jgi:ferrochelatase
MTTFQSRFGREEWLRPYTDETLKSLPGEGIHKVDIFCPGFSSDCLETLEEIDEENRGYFMAAGGKSFQYIPALNAEPHHIYALTQLIEDNLQGWSPNETGSIDLQARAARAEAMGAEK